MKYRLEWKYKIKGKKSILFTSEWLDKDLALLAGQDIEGSGKCAELFYYDEMESSWTTKEMKKLLSELEDEPHDLVIYFDGGYQKETYQGGLGAVIYYKQGNKKYRIRANELFDEMESNNEAEYAALYFSLNVLEEMGAHHMPCEIKGDSQGLLMQLKGEWPCYEENLNKWLDRIEEKLKKLSLLPTYTNISRKENKEADQLASQALEGIEINSKMQII
ncbi:reverse transcriptase-like protein [Cytobacillus spongiae]|uniref:reverse transcriptase-like protein n=1 Tax=Cytobacillus spongiae TaxID=2901381 RepID=UPI001F3452E5|nr:reverse transcriptase-like protein [Cytobacillus spongiae]UII54556.1 reverse transcriptase-like protein [Cytobacillus spongiae]